MEQWLQNEYVFSGRIFRVRAGEARLDDGTVAPREIVEHTGGVGVVPYLGDSVVLVKQYRISIGREILEIPAGRLEGDEDPAYRAACELEEEVGCRAGRLELVSKCYPSPGFTNQLDYIYLAFDIERCEQRLEFDERIEIVHLPLTDVPGMLADCAFEDAKTIIGLRELLLRLGK